MTTAMEKALVESLWIEHKRRCRRCATFDREQTATLANTCLKGAGIIKDLLAIEAKEHGPKRRRRKEQRESLPL